MLGLPPVFARPLQARTRGHRTPRAHQRPREGGRPPHTGAEGPAPQLGSGAPSARVRRPASPRALRERRRRTVADGIPGPHARCRHACGRLEAPSLHQPSAPRAGRRSARRRPRGASPARRGARARHPSSRGRSRARPRHEVPREPPPKALSVSGPRGRALSLPWAPAARRRHGARQDHAGHRRVPRAPRGRAREARDPDRPGIVEAAVEAGVGRHDERLVDAGGRLARRAQSHLCRHEVGVPRHRIRAAPAGPRGRATVRAGHRGARRGAAHQELGDEVGGVREVARGAVPPRAHRNPDGEPLRRARVDHGLRGRRGPRAEVAARPAAPARPRRRRLRARGSAQPRPPPRAARGVDAAAGTARRAVAIASPHRHARAGGDDARAGRASRRAPPAHRSDRASEPAEAAVAARVLEADVHADDAAHPR